MIFKNAMVYRITRYSEIIGSLQDYLETRGFVPTSGLRPSSFGWVAPIEGLLTDAEEPLLVHEIGKIQFLTARYEQKVIPSSSFNEIVNDKIKQIESVEGRRIRAQERKSVKENVLADLLPQALPKSEHISGYIDHDQGLLVIGTSVPNKAEMFINCLRDSIGSLALTPIQVKQKPSDIFTRWLTTRQLPERVGFGADCDLLDIEENAKIACRNQDLETQEVRSHLESGKICRAVELRHYDYRFLVTHDLILKKLRDDTLAEDISDDEDPVARFDADIVNFQAALKSILGMLISALGGENLPEGANA